MRLLIFSTIAVLGMTSALSSYNALAQSAGIKHSPTALGQWRVTRLGSSTDCILDHNPGKQGRKFAPVDTRDCEIVHKNLKTASVFVEDSLGNLMVMDEENNRLFEFTSAEFEGYESVFPEHPLLTLEPVK